MATWQQSHHFFANTATE